MYSQGKKKMMVAKQCTSYYHKVKKNERTEGWLLSNARHIRYEYKSHELFIKRHGLEFG